jgi:hypothetical protein
MGPERVGQIDDPVWTDPSSSPAQRPSRQLRGLHVAIVLGGIVLVAAAVIALTGFDLAGVLVATGLIAVLVAAASRRIGAVTLVVVLALFLGVGSLEAVNAVRFHTLDLLGPPPRVPWCGRTYELVPGTVEPSGLLGRRAYAAMAGSVAVVTPAGTVVYSPHACGAGVVPTVLMAAAPGGGWIEYVLLGGP